MDHLSLSVKLAAYTEFEACDAYTRGCTAAGQPDKMTGTNVAREQRGSNLAVQYVQEALSFFHNHLFIYIERDTGREKEMVIKSDSKG